LKENIGARTSAAQSQRNRKYFFSFQSTPRKHWQHRDVSCEDNRVHLSCFWLSLSLSTPLTRVCIVIRIDRASPCAWATTKNRCS